MKEYSSRGFSALHVMLFATLLLVIVLFGISLFQYNYINFLQETLTKSTTKNSDALDNNIYLNQRLEVASDTITQQQHSLASLDAKLDNIESMLGLSPTPSIKLKDRVNLASITSEEMQAVFENIPNGSPVEYKGITSKFGYRMHPTVHKRILHRGTDLRAAMRTPVYATADAVVEFAGWHKKSGYGRLVILSHNYGFRTMYGHLKSVDVKVGDMIKKGTLIGYSGSSGISSGPHLHYEVQYIAKSLNPYNFIKWNRSNYDAIFTKERQVDWSELIAMINKQNTSPTFASLSLK